MHIHEPCLDQFVFPQMRAVDGLSEPLTALENGRRPALGMCGLVARPIVRHELSALGLQLKVSAGSQVLKDLLEQPCFVGDAPFQFACVYKVERHFVDPFVLEVINFEHAIGRDPAPQLSIKFILETRKCQYQSGCIGLRSVPTTSAEGFPLIADNVNKVPLLTRSSHSPRFQLTLQNPSPIYQCQYPDRVRAEYVHQSEQGEAFPRG
jgi:hypothetical protein